MLARLIACLITLTLVGLGHGQSLELGLIAGTMGRGASLSSQVSDSWTVHIRGAYEARSSSQRYTSGGITYSTGDQTISGALGVSVDWKMFERSGLTAGLWTLVAERKLSLEPLTGAIAGTELPPEELGSVSVEVSLPQQPVPYVGVYRTVPLFGNWRARVDVGALRTGRSEIERRATGRLAPTALWLRETERRRALSRINPVVQVGISVKLNAPIR